MQIFFERLKSARKSKRLTQMQISKILHINQPSYARYETDKSEPSSETLVNMCKVLDESPAYLLGMDDYL